MELFINKDHYSSEEIRTMKLWIYIGLGIVILFLKFLFQVLIEDKPEWIRKEDEKWAYIDLLQGE